MVGRIRLWVRGRLDSHPRIRALLWLLLTDRLPILLNYPVQPRVRYGHGKPPHPELQAAIRAHRSSYAETLSGFVELRDALSRIELDRTVAPPQEPAWHNEFFWGLDAVALYGMLRRHDPGRFVEIGSGNSTKFARRAVRDGGLRTRIVSIDPEPRAEIDPVCDTIIRRRLEDADLSLFSDLEAGDIVFMDGSHRVFQNSDATVFFLEIVPRLRPGVLIHVHDVFLPSDYPPDWTDTFFSEQYLLAAFLLGKAPQLEPVLPNYFVTQDDELNGLLTPLWSDRKLGGLRRDARSFWARTT